MLLPTVSRPVCLGGAQDQTSGAQDQTFVTIRHFPVCSLGAPSLMRGRVSRLKLLLALASVDIFTAVQIRVHVIFIYNFTCKSNM
jgi:hypothetical protein